MGDSIQNLVAPDLTADRAKAEGNRMRSWLIGEGIISPETKDCVLGADAGNPPGPQYTKATGYTDPHLLRLRSNGFAVITKRTVFHSGQGGLGLVCSACESKFEPPDAWGDALNEWFHQKGPGTLACPACGVSRSIVDWRHDPQWAFGNLGFQFWNWPQFTPTFVRDLEEQLGSRIVYVFGKL